jgi:hypothetical protein
MGRGRVSPNSEYNSTIKALTAVCVCSKLLTLATDQIAAIKTNHPGGHSDFAERSRRAQISISQHRTGTPCLIFET